MTRTRRKIVHQFKREIASAVVTAKAAASEAAMASAAAAAAVAAHPYSLLARWRARKAAAVAKRCAMAAQQAVLDARSLDQTVQIFAGRLMSARQSLATLSANG